MPRTVKTQSSAYAENAQTYRLAVAGALEWESGNPQELATERNGCDVAACGHSKAPRPVPREPSGAQTPLRKSVKRDVTSSERRTNLERTKRSGVTLNRAILEIDGAINTLALAIG